MRDFKKKNRNNTRHFPKHSSQTQGNSTSEENVRPQVKRMKKIHNQSGNSDGNYSVSGTKWYNMFSYEEDFKQLSPDQVDKLRYEAKKFLEQETATYNSKMSKNPVKSDYNWIRTIMNKGTVMDRVAAHTISIQDSPVHTLPLLQSLVGMVKVGKKKEGIMVLDTLTELFLSDLLRPNEKLTAFENCPLALLDKYSSGNHHNRKSRLIHWYYEDQLKKLYQTFVNALYTTAQDSVERNKEKAISAMCKLLSGNPEQEALLLKNIINKLGDPQQKIASKAVYCLIQLLKVHPNMKTVIMEETEKLLFRINLSHRAQYNGVCFLSQFILSSDDTELARNLIQIYFSFFKACVKKGEVDSRLMRALLTGVSRAYPYAKPDMEKMLEHIDTMYRVVHNATFTVSLHTLCLLFQVSDFANTISDRFYSALYKKMLDPQLASSSHQALFLSIVFKALKKDDNVERVKVFFKRLFQLCEYMPVPLVCGILCMISQLTHKKENLLAFSMVPKSFIDDDQDEEHYADIKVEVDEECVPSETSEVKETKDIATVASIPTWYHCGNSASGPNKQRVPPFYNPFHRNPLFAGGEYCVYTELLKLSQHFHPSVMLFANKILQGETVKYPGDPLQDFALPRFLDRFVFKNPKKIEEESASSSKFSRTKSYAPKGIRSLRVDSANYLNEDESRIPVEELFMYRYLHKKMSEGVKKEVKEEDDDASSVASEEFNQYLEEMIGDNKGEIDFAEEVGKHASSKREDSDEENEEDNEKNTAEVHESDEESDISQEENNENLDDDDDEDDILNDEDLDDDAEDIVFDDSESDIELDVSDEEPTLNGKKRHKLGMKVTKKRGADENPFVLAEEFAEMLDNAGAARLKMSGSSALSNRDNAGEKQLKWETARDYWVKKGDKQSKKSYGAKRKWAGHQNKSSKRRK